MKRIDSQLIKLSGPDFAGTSIAKVLGAKATSRNIGSRIRTRVLITACAVAAVAGLIVLSAPGARAAAPARTCAGLRATIVGTARSDVIRGTARADVIVGLGGDDRIYGLGGNDVICGGAGDDFIDGGGGNDRAIGGVGRNTCVYVERRSGCVVDRKPPALVAARVDGDRLVATFDEPLDGSRAPDPKLFAVAANAGVSLTVASAKVVGRTVELRLSRPALSDDQVTLGLVDAAVADLSGNRIVGQFPVPIQNATAAAGCNPYIAAGAPGQTYLSPAGPRPSNLLPSTVGELHALMLFVDFSDAPGRNPPDAIYHAFADPTQAWYAAVSYGRLRLTVTPFLQWLRMPQPSGSYGVSRLGDPTLYTAYLRQAIALADPLVDFHGYDIVYVVAAGGASVGTGPAWFAVDPLATPDGVPIRAAAGEPAALVGAGNPNYTFTHETGHMLGLPDLYDVNALGDQVYGFVGRWDLMSYIDGEEGLMAWQRWQLGWLDPDQIRCVRPDSTLSVPLAPLERSGGVKMIVISTSPTTATVIENRQAEGEDANVCYPGALVYHVDSAFPTGRGPIRVTPAHDDVGVDSRRCGLFARAAIQPGESFADPASGAKIDVAAATNGALAVTVTRP